jgi:hypothetical protein
VKDEEKTLSASNRPLRPGLVRVGRRGMRASSELLGGVSGDGEVDGCREERGADGQLSMTKDENEQRRGK